MRRVTGSNRFGSFRRVRAAAGGPPRRTHPPRPKACEEVNVPRLVVFRGDAVESEVRLSGGPVRIGRHAGNDVVLDDSLNGVSRFHAEIRARRQLVRRSWT